MIIGMTNIYSFLHISLLLIQYLLFSLLYKTIRYQKQYSRLAFYRQWYSPPTFFKVFLKILYYKNDL